MPDLNEVYHELGELKGATRSLGRSVDNVTEALKEHASAEKKDSDRIYTLIEKHEARLQGLEKWMAWSRGIFAAIAIALSAGAGWLRFLKGSGGPPA